MRTTTLAPAVCAALSLAAGAASAQFELVGSACPGESGIVPTIAGDGFPTVGGPGYTIEVTGPASTVGFAAVGGFELVPPLDLTGLGLPGCFLYNNIAFTVGFATDDNGDGTGDFTFAVPAPTAGGVVFYVQAYLADLGPSTLGSVTESLEVTTIAPSGFTGGEIIVNEFLRDPNTISDNDGEWVELYNTTGSAIDIEGWFIGDLDFDSHQIDVGGAGVIVPAGGYALLGINADILVNGGIALDYQYSDFFLSNSFSGDEIVITDFSGVQIDKVEYSQPSWPLAGGQSASLDPGSQDAASNDDPANWCLETSIYDVTAGVNAGTPGVANNDCAAPITEKGDIIVTEIMQNPSALSDGEGEYFEVYNTTGSAIDIEGWTISDLGFDSHVIDAGGAGVIVPAGGYAVLSTGAAPGFTPDYVYGGGWFLSNSADEVVITDDVGQLQDEVIYDGGPIFPDPNGASMNLDPGSLTAAANNDGANWCEASTAYSTGDLGTPGTANDVCP